MVAPDPSSLAQTSNNVPPPFLTKTYEMVDDPSTDSIVSWSDSNNSFVVWNISDFSRDLLPQYFKHSNFSSFVRQLNTYGFHKIDPDRWEFANEEFSKGNKESLKNIHRRKPTASAHGHGVHSPKDSICNDPRHAELEEEISRLNQDKSVMVAELVKLRQQQKMTEMELQTIGNRLQATDKKHQQMISFLARVMRSPGSWMHVMELQKEGIRLELNKKRRLWIGGEEDMEGAGESGFEDMEVGQMMLGYSVHMPEEEEEEKGDDDQLEHMVMQLARSTINHHHPHHTLNNQHMSTSSSPNSRSSGVTLLEEPRLISLHSHSHTDCAASPTTPPGNCEKDNSCLRASTTLTVTNTTAAAASSSNDIFWENLLTENPKVADKGEERWFL